MQLAVISSVIMVIVMADLSPQRFEEFREEILELVDCDDIFEECAGLTLSHPDVTLYDSDSAPFMNHPIIGGLVRLSFHDCGGIDPQKVKSGNTNFFTDPIKNGAAGGCNGCIGIDNPSNDNLLDAAIEPLLAICPYYEQDGMSRADCWALAATIALEYSSNKLDNHRNLFGLTINASIVSGDIPYYYGRADCMNGFDEHGNDEIEYEFSNPHGVLFEFPDAMLGWNHMADFLKSRFGWNNNKNDYFTNRDIVALIAGAHSIGRAHEKISGFSGSWDFSAATIDPLFVSSLFGEEIGQHQFGVIQNLNQSTRNPTQNGSKPQWEQFENAVVYATFPMLLQLDPPLLKLSMILNTDFSLVFDISYWIENGMQNNIDCNSNAKLICPSNQILLTAPRGQSSMFNKGMSAQQLGEQTVCNDDEDCCQYIQCPIQCEGGWREFQRLVDNDLIDTLHDKSNCPAGLAYKYSVGNQVNVVERNQFLGTDFVKAFNKMITIGYTEKSGKVLLKMVSNDDDGNNNGGHPARSSDNKLDDNKYINSNNVSRADICVFSVFFYVMLLCTLTSFCIPY